MDYLPIFMRIRGQKVCVVGGGTIAARKSDLFIQAGALVTVIAPELRGEMQRMVAENQVTWVQSDFEPALLASAKLVLAATDDQTVNEAVYASANALNIPVNIADQTELCEFILPSIMQRGPITLAVSTGGRSPTLARHLRVELEKLVPSRMGDLAELLKELRAQYNPLMEEATRKDFWQALLNGAFYSEALAGRWDKARELCAQAFADFQANLALSQGEVYLIGAGPGDVELLTLKALRLLQTADVVVYDRLVSEEILNLARREAERIYVGKAMSNHALPQEQINQLLVDLAKQGKKVARLKGGDPYIFGRGAEEQALLRAHNVSCTVVPGISSASGIAAATGIPLTHRDYAQSVKLVTGHTKEGLVELDWACLVDPNQTLVVYMGLSNIAIICQQLIEHGMDSATPLAVIENGTRANQRVLVSDLANAPQNVAQSKIQAPALIMIGCVVACVEPSVCMDIAETAMRNEVRYG